MEMFPLSILISPKNDHSVECQENDSDSEQKLLIQSRGMLKQW